MKMNWFNSAKYFSTDESVKINWFKNEKYIVTDESVKRQITDSISENLTDSDLESAYSSEKSVIKYTLLFNLLKQELTIEFSKKIFSILQ